jgi:microcystin-dependent protein
MTSQNFVKQIDLTGLTQLTGSQMNQLLETGLLADDKGMNLYTVDTALGVPNVPDPEQGELEGVDVAFWIRYTWVRVPHTSAPPESTVKQYNWNPQATADATYLKWETLSDYVDEIAANSNVAITNAALAQETADTALALAQTIEGNVATNTTNITNLTNRVSELESAVDDLQGGGSNAGHIIGQVIDYLGTDVPTGFLMCNGQAVSRTTYASLFAKISTRFGAGDGSTTFNLPDFEDRVAMGASNSTYIPPTGGASTVSLAITNVPDHGHLPNTLLIKEYSVGLGTDDQASGTGYGNVEGIAAEVSGGVRNTDGSAVSALGQPFSIVPAHVRVFKLIKAI